MKRLVLSSAVVVAFAGCGFLRGNSGSGGSDKLARPATTFQSTYYTIQEDGPGRYTCAPKGPLADLEAAGCFADAAGCKQGYDAATGAARPETLKVYADTLTRTDTAFAYQCVGLSRPASGPEHLEHMGLIGLGLAGDTASLDRELALDVPSQRDSDWHKAMRGDLAFALWNTQNAEKALPKIIELAQLQGTDEMQRAAMVLYVGRWENNGLVDMCAQQLTAPSSDATGDACVWYLAHIKAPDALGMIAKADARFGAAQIRALGWTGEAKAAEVINKLAGSNPQDALRVVTKVALLNAGKKDALKDVLAMLGGTVSGKRNNEDKLDADDLSLEATLEILALANRSFDKDIVKALQKLNANKNEQIATAALIVLAYLNDPPAMESLTAVLAGADDNLRKFILENTGGLSDIPGRRYTTGSCGVLPSKAFAQSVGATYATTANDVAGRALAARTIAAIRIVTRSAE